MFMMESDKAVSNVHKGMDFLEKRRELEGKEQKLPSSKYIYRLPGEGVSQIRSHFKIWSKGVLFKNLG